MEWSWLWSNMSTWSMASIALHTERQKSKICHKPWQYATSDKRQGFHVSSWGTRESSCELHTFACIHAPQCTQDAANNLYLLRGQDRVCTLCMEAQLFLATATQQSSPAQWLQLTAMAQAVLWPHQTFPAVQKTLFISVMWKNRVKGDLKEPESSTTRTAMEMDWLS